MNILPLSHISETDQPIFGANIFNLSKLLRGDLPVASGIAISPPEIIFNTVLKHIESAKEDVFEQKINLIKKEILDIPMPEELEKELGSKKSFFLNGKVFKKKKEVWGLLLQIWFDEIKSLLWSKGFQNGISTNLAPVLVFFDCPDFLTVKAFFDPDLGEVVIKSEKELSPVFLKQIDQLVIEANKKLFLPQVYQIVIASQKIKIVGLSPFTQSLPVSRTEDIVITKDEKRKVVKSAVKVLLNLSTGYATQKDIDGVLVEGEKVKGFDEVVFRLTEAALSFPAKPIIYKLPDTSDQEIRGTLRLLNHSSLLEQAIDAFLFARNKKNLWNLELAVPFVRSPEEFLQIKRELSVKGIIRKGTLKIWMELSVPENFVNLEDYLTIGVDGVIINLDELQKFLGGYGVEDGQYYKKQVQSLIKFMTPSFRALHKSKVLILAKGELCLHPEVLDCLIEGGIWGVMANNPLEAESIPDHLNWCERRIIMRKFD